MNSESLTLCEHPNVFTCTTPRPGMGGDLGASRSRGERRATNVAAAESLVASPKLSEARTFSSSTSSAPLAEGLAAPDPARARTFTTGGRSLVTRAPSAASAPPRSSRSSRSAILPLPAPSLASLALPRRCRAPSPPPSLAARPMRGNAARASLATAQGDTSFSSRFAAREGQNKSTLAAGGRRETATAKRASFSTTFFRRRSGDSHEYPVVSGVSNARSSRSRDLTKNPS